MDKAKLIIALLIIALLILTIVSFPSVNSVISWQTFLLISALLLVLMLAKPSPLYPHIITFDLLLIVGMFLGTSLQLLLGDISHIRWVPYAWVGLSVTVSIFTPFPFLKSEDADPVDTS